MSGVTKEVIDWKDIDGVIITIDQIIEELGVSIESLSRKIRAVTSSKPEELNENKSYEFKCSSPLAELLKGNVRDLISLNNQIKFLYQNIELKEMEQ